jgi:hypothetical protein
VTFRPRFQPRDGSDRLAKSLRELFIRHNCQVLGFALLSLAAAAVFWMLLYAACSCLVLVVQAISEKESAPLPEGFSWAFGSVAASLIAIAWFDQAMIVNDRPVDRKPSLEVFMDCLLAVPRTTLAVWGNLSAWQWLNQAELRLAAALILRIVRERKIPLQSAPLDIPEERLRAKIIFALLMIRVLDVRSEDGAPWLRLSPLRPETLRLPNDQALEAEP